jgi:hypothetical protein
MTSDEIIQALTTFTPTFPREALSEAPQHREELIPRLLDSLDYVAENLKTLMEEKSDYHLHFFAMFLLAQFREQRAFPKLVRFLHNSDAELRFIAGDALTENYNAILCSTYNGDIKILQEVIEDDTCYEFARSAAMRAYAFIVRDGHISRDGMLDYLRHVIRGLKAGDMAVAASVVNVIIDEHIFELLPEARALYDRDLVDRFACGTYDSFVNYVFAYHHYDHAKKIHIDDVIGELSTWSCYTPEKPSKPKPADPLPAPAAPTPAASELKAKKKIGRNDPCPCGSGKKYKKCCLPKGITFKEETGKGEAGQEESGGSGPADMLEKLFTADLRELYDDKKPYNLLSGYPGLDPEAREGERKFAEFFSPEAIGIDVPVYKALHHRAIPLWIRRDRGRENRERIDLLLEAFTLFTQTCARDSIDSFDAFDRKYMVHYHAIEWITRLKDLLEQYEDEIPDEQYATLKSVSQTLERMGGTHGSL